MGISLAKLKLFQLVAVSSRCGQTMTGTATVGSARPASTSIAAVGGLHHSRLRDEQVPCCSEGSGRRLTGADGIGEIEQVQSGLHHSRLRENGKGGSPTTG